MKRNLLFILAGLTLGIGLPVFGFIPAETARFLPAHEVSAGTDAGERRCMNGLSKEEFFN